MRSIADEYTHNGVPVRIYYDEDPSNPREDFTGCTILAWHRRSNIGDDGFNYRDLPDFDTKDELVQWLKDEHGAVAVRPLYLYEHGGMSVSLGAFSDPWDSGQVGYVFVTQGNLDETGADADTLMEGEVKEYDSYLQGEVYGFVVDEDGDNEESCWGFIGDIAYCKEEANSLAEWVAKERVREAGEAAHWAARDTITV
jgi:hypothetical protein